MKKNIILSLCVLFALLGTVAVITWNGHYRKALSPGDIVSNSELAGTWKLVSVKEGWFTTTDDAKLEQQNYAVYWAVFDGEGNVNLSYAPKPGELDKQFPYHIEDNWILFDDAEMLERKMKLDSGKLIFVNTVGTKVIFELEKQGC